MITYILCGIPLLYLFALVYPKNWFSVNATERGGIFRFGKLIRIVEPGFHHIWPWEEYRVDDTRVQEAKIPITDMAVIGITNMLFRIDLQIFFQILDPIALYLKYKGNIIDALISLAEGALTQALNQMKDINPFDSTDGKNQLYELSERILRQDAADLGIVIEKYVFQRVYPPKSVLAKSEQIMDAEGTAASLKILSDAQAAQAEALGNNFLPLQAIKAVQEAIEKGSANGAFKTFVLGEGSVSSLLQLIDQEGKDKNDG
ncbi:MAG: SPFH domain-containing protein [Microgenomates group bacterium]